MTNVTNPHKKLDKAAEEVSVTLVALVHAQVPRTGGKGIPLQEAPLHQHTNVRYLQHEDENTKNNGKCDLS